MPAEIQPRLVFDPEVILEGLQRPGSAAGNLMDGWLSGMLYVLLSDALAYATVDYLMDNYPHREWQRLRPLVGGLVARAHFVPIHYDWRPFKPDSDSTDRPVVTCAMNGAGIVVAAEKKEYVSASDTLGLVVTTPPELVAFLAE